MRTGNYDGATITALGHAGFRVEYPEKGFSFAFDPYDISETEPVDFIFISHPHFDHCDPASIRKLLKKKTKVIAPNVCAKELAEFGEAVELVDDKNKRESEFFKYWTVPAYNIDKFRTPSEVFHPKEKGYVGWIVEVGSTRYYHAGDTDMTPEMEALKKIDVAFLPISGTFVMTLEEAMKAAEILEPDVTIPMHFGKLLGSVSEANRFQNLLRDKLKVMVLSTESFD
jgi:L-ascorbate metabolism protein UlaG (beta-lactamase superfamily)